MNRILLSSYASDKSKLAKLKRLYNWIVLFRPTWSNLSLYGNSLFARLTILAPIVAQGIHHFEEWVGDVFGLTNILWLYWSLMAIGLAQVIYFIGCPREIKKYGNNEEQYKIEALAVHSEGSLDIVYNNYIASQFENNLSWVPPKRFDYTDKFKLKELNQAELSDLLVKSKEKLIGKPYAAEVTSVIHNRELLVFIEYVNFKQLVDKGSYTGKIDWKIIQTLLELHPELYLADISQSFPVLNTREKYAEDNVAWKLTALDWAYHSFELIHPKTRWATFVLYLLGTVYFLVYGFLNVGRMLITTFS